MQITLKTSLVFCQLILQKLKNSKTKSIRKKLERRMELWNAGDIPTLIYEARALQNRCRLKHTASNDDFSGWTRRFIKLIKNGKMRVAMRLIEHDNKRCNVFSPQDVYQNRSV
ncbi:hypothetical protein GJ496_000173 [Pomphorhynchus laevis]|nr:hypothetical protein GJ496_000173 [Pomphorhynchus laevis]